MKFENFSEDKASEKNYYDILGVSLNASSEEIRVAFRNLVKETHPDVVGDDSRMGDFYKINQAYETLIDEDKRKSYDYKTFSHNSSVRNSQGHQNTEERGLKNDTLENILEFVVYFLKNNPAKRDDIKEYFKELVYYETDKLKKEKYRTVINKINETIDNLSHFDKEYNNLYNEMMQDDKLREYLSLLKAQDPEKYEKVVKEYLDVLREDKRMREKIERDREAMERRKRDHKQKFQARKEELKHKIEDVERKAEELKKSGQEPFLNLFSNNGHWMHEWQRTRNLVDNIGVETTVNGYCRLVDCNTGRGIGYNIYKNIEYQYGVIIGTDLSGYKHIVTKDGKSSSDFYQDIIFRDGLVIAKDVIGGERLLNKNTGQPVNYQSYKIIQRVGNKIFGTNIIGRQEEIKL